tara:strand:- start:111 stop:452 length:342 start_codon:yes stop_codon:yes gene_type:complete
MKLTKNQLKQIIKEELQKALRESFETDSEALKTELKQAWKSGDPNLVGKSREFIAATVLQFWGHMNDEDIWYLVEEAIKEYNVENPDEYDIQQLEWNRIDRALNAMAQQREER